MLLALDNTTKPKEKDNETSNIHQTTINQIPTKQSHKTRPFTPEKRQKSYYKKRRRKETKTSTHNPPTPPKKKRKSKWTNINR